MTNMQGFSGNLAEGQSEGSLFIARTTSMYMDKKLVFPVPVASMARRSMPSRTLQTPSICTSCGSKDRYSLRIRRQSANPSGELKKKGVGASWGTWWAFMGGSCCKKRVPFRNFRSLINALNINYCATQQHVFIKRPKSRGAVSTPPLKVD